MSLKFKSSSVNAALFAPPRTLNSRMNNPLKQWQPHKMIIVIYYYHKFWTGVQWCEWCEHENLIEAPQYHSTASVRHIKMRKCVHRFLPLSLSWLSIHLLVLCNVNNETLFANVVYGAIFQSRSLFWAGSKEGWKIPTQYWIHSRMLNCTSIFLFEKALCSPKNSALQFTWLSSFLFANHRS
jgi:hypothetical protein